MNLKHCGLLCAIMLGGVSCMEVNNELGKNFLPSDRKYDIYTAEIPLEDIRMEMTDSLSGYSDSRITVGAVRDSVFGLTTRSSAFTLVPLQDTLDFGTNPVFRRFHFAAAADTVSVPEESQMHILQNIYVYELEKPLDFGNTNTAIEHRHKIITKTIPVYDGSDSLSFDFSDEFGLKYMQILQEDLDTMPAFTAKFPGIYIETDAPTDNGGRINMFRLSSLSLYNNSYYLNTNLATLYFSSVYDGERKDTCFYFVFGETDLYDETEFVSMNTKFPQYAFNSTGHETAGKAGPAGEHIYIEGGGGLKPVISAREIREKVRADIENNGGDPAMAVINKATLVLPFEMPDNYLEMNLFPTIISPTVRIATDTSVTFAGLADASNSSENQGDIDRSNCRYAPDITHHLQELIKINDTSKLSNYDIWFLIVAQEIVETATESNYDSEYYQNLLYANYYNSIYGNGYYGGYGGYYGGYGGYGYNSYYNNYMNYMLLASMMSGSSDETTTTEVLDKDRYYRARLNGPAGGYEKKPVLKVTYTLPREYGGTIE